MEVISNCAFPVASLVWRPRPEAWVLTVVCRATYLLRPGECTLAPLQEVPADDDRTWDDAPARSIRSPRDLVPVKPNVDVLLVGYAFAPGGRPVRSLVTRLAVGELDKAIEVVADRTLRPDGSVREGQPFAQMALAWERAAGGPGTANPVGIRRDVRDAEGAIALPNLQRPGSAPHHAFQPVGYGPIAPTWPERRDRLGVAHTGWSFRDLDRGPLPEGMDLGYFNAAPADQQIRALGERVSLVLENLHPEHARLSTIVPCAAPRAIIDGRRAGLQPITLRADTLWIDTERSRCTVTFRGMVPLEGPTERIRVIVSVSAPEVAAVPTQRGVDFARLEATTDIPLSVRQASRPALPFAPIPAAPAPAPAPPAIGSPWAAGARPVALGSETPVAPARPAAPSPPAPISYVSAPAPSVLDASNIAAGPRSEPMRGRPAAPPEVLAPEPQPRSAAARAEIREAIELVWFDTDSMPRIRRKAAWRPILEALERAPIDPDFDDPTLAKEPLLVEERREVFEVLACGEPLGPEALSDTLERCVRGDGKFVPTLALLAGEIELPFDEVAVLRATLTTVAPLVGQDEALKSAADTARDFLGTMGLISAPAVAEGLTKRIEDAFAQGKRVVPPGYLEAQRERALSEQRQHQVRVVFGEKHLRGLLDLGEGEPKPGPAPKGASAGAGRVPAYVPERVLPFLPIASRFRARFVAEVRLPADRYETHPAALRVLALARAASPPRR